MGTCKITHATVFYYNKIMTMDFSVDVYPSYI